MIREVGRGAQIGRYPCLQPQQAITGRACWGTGWDLCYLRDVYASDHGVFIAMPTISLAALSAIARHHGVVAPRRMPVPWVGATSRVFPCADVVVKIPFDEPSSIQAVRIDAC